MGSATVSNAKPIAMETTDKKTLKTLIKSLLFPKKKEKNRAEKKEVNSNTEHRFEAAKKTENLNPVAALLENFNKLELEKKSEVKTNNVLVPNELDNFAFKVIEEHRNERINSQSSQDSGYSENSEKNENKDGTDGAGELIEGLEKLDLDKDEKKKKLKTIVVARAPVRPKVCNYASAPYPVHDSDSYRQIHQINKHALSGGQVIVNQPAAQDSLLCVELACQLVASQARLLREQEGYLEDVLDYIQQDAAAPPQDTTNPSISEYEDLERRTEDEFKQLIQEISEGRDCMPQSTDNQYTYTNNSIGKEDQYTNNLIGKEDAYTNNNLIEKQEEMYSNNLINNDEEQFTNNLIGKEDLNCIFNYVERELGSNIFPTPPHSENVPSPMLGSPGSFYPTNSEYTLSPECSPVYNSDFEKYQEIPHFEEEKIGDDADKKPRERTNSISCMTMKQFKDLQKDIAYEFSKKECCQTTRKSCKEVFQEYLEKVDREERKSMCSQVAKLDLKICYGVLQNILLGLSRGPENEQRQYVLFALICEKILTTDPKVFIGDVGLNLVKAAALRCPHRPLLTRYVVHCVRTALKSDPALFSGKECVFHEVDALGDNLVSACARGGDRFADVLAEVVRPHTDQPPLFRVHHANADGRAALHVACGQHSGGCSRLHIVHVLLQHANADLWKGDIKGGDTALHLAVNSANCDLKLIMLIFKHVDRKMWKALAHLQNMSSVTPIELARSATKSTTRQNYPPEVLDFLKKCR